MADLIERYVRAGLRLGRHNSDIVDSYYGPPAWRAEINAEPVRAPSDLVAECKALIAELDSNDTEVLELDAQRRRWLRSQTVGLMTVARKLNGDAIDFLDEVEACYGVRPERITEDEVHAAHVALSAALPGTGTLEQRVAAIRDAHVVPVDALRAVIDNLAQTLRPLTIEKFGLPDEESVEFDLVSDKPYSGFNFYQGNFRSLVTINVDLPVSSTSIAHLIAHEAYPGHHTEHCHKELGLVRRAGRLEQSIALIGTPACLMAEGLADLGLEIVLDADPTLAVEPLMHDAGVPYDTEAVLALAQFSNVIERARGTLACQLNMDGRSIEDVEATAKRWLIVDDARARQVVRFISDPSWRAYVFCYAEGYRLCRSFVDGDPRRFARLLDEQLVPSDLV
jgi:phosphohistidine swiveling domain-containing protein